MKTYKENILVGLFILAVLATPIGVYLFEVYDVSRSEDGAQVTYPAPTVHVFYNAGPGDRIDDAGAGGSAASEYDNQASGAGGGSAGGGGLILEDCKQIFYTHQGGVYGIGPEETVHRQNIHYECVSVDRN